MKLLSRTKYFLLLSLLLFSSCEEEIDSKPLVFTEEIIFVSGEILRVTGRIVAVGQIPVTDHGFQVADNEAFSSPESVSLGERSVPGRFIGIFENLHSETDYFVRAFMEVNGELSFGETSEFRSLSSEVFDYTTAEHVVGSSVTISGRNLDSDLEVFFGTKKATIVEFSFEAVVKVTIPAPAPGVFEVPIKVISDGNELILPEIFRYNTGKWTQESVLPESMGVGRNTHFSGNGTFYYGVRYDENASTYFLNYDLLQKKWSHSNFGGTPVERGITFEGGYIGGAQDVLSRTSVVNSREFWTVNTNGNFQFEGLTPFSLFNGKAFKVNNTLYVFGGVGNDFTPNSIIYTYDFSGGTWVSYDTSPFQITDELASFEHNGLMYFINSDKELWRYDPQLKNWTLISNYPGMMAEEFSPNFLLFKDEGIGGVIGDFAYVGLANGQRSIWEYDIKNNLWNPKIVAPGTNNVNLIGWYTTSDKLYIIRGTTLWEFDPFSL